MLSLTIHTWLRLLKDPTFWSYRAWITETVLPEERLVLVAGQQSITVLIMFSWIPWTHRSKSRNSRSTTCSTMFCIDLISMLVFQELICGPRDNELLAQTIPEWCKWGVRYVGAIRFVFHGLQLLPIKFTQCNLCCIIKSTIEYQRKSSEDWSSHDLVMLIGNASLLIPCWLIGSPNCVHYCVWGSY